jgi:hypothetical protein
VFSVSVAVLATERMARLVSAATTGGVHRTASVRLLRWRRRFIRRSGRHAFMPLLVDGKAPRPQGHALVEAHAVADERGLADDRARPVILDMSFTMVNDGDWASTPRAQHTGILREGANLATNHARQAS